MNTYFLDENIEGPIARALGQTDLTFVRIQDTEYLESDDPAILKFTAEAGYVLVTHDQATLPAFFWEHIMAGEDHPGLIVIPSKHRKRVSDIITFLEAIQAENLMNQVWWFPTLPLAKEESDEHTDH